MEKMLDDCAAYDLQNVYVAQLMVRTGNPASILSSEALCRPSQQTNRKSGNALV